MDTVCSRLFGRRDVVVRNDDWDPATCTSVAVHLLFPPCRSSLPKIAADWPERAECKDGHSEPLHKGSGLRD